MDTMADPKQPKNAFFSDDDEADVEEEEPLVNLQKEALQQLAEEPEADTAAN
jgi:hypothetical protein